MDSDEFQTSIDDTTSLRSLSDFSLGGTEVEDLLINLNNETTDNKLLQLFKNMEESNRLLAEINQKLVKSNKKLLKSNKELTMSNKELTSNFTKLNKSFENSVIELLEKNSNIYRLPTSCIEISNVFYIKNYFILRKDIGQMNYTKSTINYDNFNFNFSYCLSGVNYDNFGYLSLFIYERNYQPVNITLSVTLVNHTNLLLNHSSTLNLNLSGGKYKLSSYGWNRFIKNLDLLSLGYLYDNNLEFKFKIIINQ